MKLLLDQNLSPNLVAKLRADFPGSSDVRMAGLQTATDESVWEHARQHGFALVTKDFDFFHRSVSRGHPPKVVWLNIGNSNTSTVLSVLQRHIRDIQAFEADETPAILVLKR